MKFFDKKLSASIHWCNLPHWSQSDAVQFITFRLNDSLPQILLQQYKELRRICYNEHNDSDHSALSGELVSRMDEWLDKGYGECVLRKPEARKIVTDAFHHFDGTKYQLLSYVVMPNHVHLLLIPWGEEDLYATIESIKRYTAKHINALSGRKGPLWQKDVFDYMPRSYAEFNSEVEYIAANPSGLPESDYTLWFRPEADWQ